MSGISDRDLLASLQQGDEQAFQTIFDRYWQQCYAIAYHRLGDEQAADDLVQELFISLWERRNSIQINSSLEAYLLGAVKFKVIDLIRSRSVRQKVLEELKQRMSELEDPVLTALDHQALDKDLNDALQTLNGNVRTAFLLRSDNLSITEIAKQMGLKEQTVRNYIAEALQQMRSLLKRKYADNPALSAAISLSFIHHYLT